MKYEKPTVVDYGSIASHTFMRGMGGTPPKDTMVCTKDNAMDESCPAAGPTP